MEQKPPSPVSPAPAPVPPSPEPTSPMSAAAESVAPCLLTLQCSGVGWGVRKRVRYVGRHLARHSLSLPDGDRAVAAQEDEESSTEAKKEKDESPEPEQQEAAEESSEDDDHKAAITTEKKRRRRKTRGHRGRGRGRAKRPKKEEEEKTLPAPKAEKLEEEEGDEEKAAAPPDGMVDRWKAARYSTAEASLLAILRSHGARAGNLIPRGELRKEARAHIGDTGLLDHLLRHIADKLAPGRAERFRRRHNPDGAMEYWLEPANLVAVRREAGVADPYWVPPPGWKPGNPVSPEAYALEVKKQVEQLAGVKRHMERLTSNAIQVGKAMTSEADKSYDSWQDKYTCMMKANGNLEKQLLSLEEKYKNARQANGELREELLFLKEKYVSVVENNIRLEQQMAALSTSFLSLKEDLLWVTTEEQHMLEKEQDDLYVKVPWEDGDDKQEGDAGKATDGATAAVAAAANHPAVDGGDGTTTTTSNGTDGRGSSGKRTSRKCSVRISKLQGTFQWPSLPFSPELAAPMSPLTPTADIVVAGANSLSYFATMDELCEYMMAGGLPTAPSASSTNAGKLLPLPTPASPAQPSPPPSTTAAAHDLQTLLRHTGRMQDAPAPCRTSPGKAAALGACAGGGNVGTELALATPTY